MLHQIALGAIKPFIKYQQWCECRHWEVMITDVMAVYDHGGKLLPGFGFPKLEPEHFLTLHYYCTVALAFSGYLQSP